jgi:hypothetical protein
LLMVITRHSDTADLGHWTEGLRGLAQWMAEGRPED